MNFENAEGLDFEISEEEISWGINVSKYPIPNSLFASYNAILYAEQTSVNASPS